MPKFTDEVILNPAPTAALAKGFTLFPKDFDLPKSVISDVKLQRNNSMIKVESFFKNPRDVKVQATAQMKKYMGSVSHEEEVVVEKAESHPHPEVRVEVNTAGLVAEPESKEEEVVVASTPPKEKKEKPVEPPAESRQRIEALIPANGGAGKAPESSSDDSSSDDSSSDEDSKPLPIKSPVVKTEVKKETKVPANGGAGKAPTETPKPSPKSPAVLATKVALDDEVKAKIIKLAKTGRFSNTVGNNEIVSLGELFQQDDKVKEAYMKALLNSLPDSMFTVKDSEDKINSTRRIYLRSIINNPIDLNSKYRRIYTAITTNSPLS